MELKRFDNLEPILPGYTKRPGDPGFDWADAVGLSYHQRYVNTLRGYRRALLKSGNSWLPKYRIQHEEIIRHLENILGPCDHDTCPFCLHCHDEGCHMEFPFCDELIIEIIYYHMLDGVMKRYGHI